MGAGATVEVMDIVVAKQQKAKGWEKVLCVRLVLQQRPQELDHVYFFISSRDPFNVRGDVYIFEAIVLGRRSIHLIGAISSPRLRKRCRDI